VEKSLAVREAESVTRALRRSIAGHPNHQSAIINRQFLLVVDSAISMKRRLLRVALLLFGSGMTALIYQVAWMRELRLVFGVSTGGLGGRSGDLHGRPGMAEN
jgi:hypothetical protein